jgi:hypothetical protein
VRATSCHPHRANSVHRRAAREREQPARPRAAGPVPLPSSKRASGKDEVVPRRVQVVVSARTVHWAIRFRCTSPAAVKCPPEIAATRAAARAANRTAVHRPQTLCTRGHAKSNGCASHAGSAAVGAARRRGDTASRGPPARQCPADECPRASHHVSTGRPTPKQYRDVVRARHAHFPFEVEELNPLYSRHQAKSSGHVAGT